MITKELAKEFSADNEGTKWVETGIESAMYDSMYYQLFHCDWDTPMRYDVTDMELDAIETKMAELVSLGYKVSIKIFEQTDDFPNRRVNLHISWED